MKIALAIADGRSTVVAKTADNRVLLSRLSKKESMFDDEASWEATDTVLDVAGDDVEFMLLDKEQRNLYLASRQSITVVDVGDASAPAVKHKLNLVENGQQITSVEFLNGENSCWSAMPRASWHSGHWCATTKTTSTCRNYAASSWPIARS
ncbi:hypothetical protein [Methylomonas koyamae]|uniref:hypothetical protein n=1 Tax=Methylomonas koyamae TaxID=702114 RepID=UPI000A6243EE|nr:hypothetical protein [Methylomonas koyamae]